MANPAFKKIVVRNALLSWPKLDQPYRYNSQQKSSEACAETAQGAAWSVGLSLSMEEAQELKKELRAHFDECKKTDSKLGEFKKVFGAKPNDEKTIVTFTAKKRCISSSGKTNPAPKMVDGMKRPLKDRRIYSGSMANVVLLAHPVVDPQGDSGISLILDKLQITKAVYGDGDDEFDQVETEYVNAPEGAGGDAPEEDDPFGLPPIEKAPEAAGKPSDDFDDEIPF